MPPAAGPGWRRAFVVTVTTGRWGSSRFQPNGCWRTGCYPTGPADAPPSRISRPARGARRSAPSRRPAALDRQLGDLLRVEVGAAGDGEDTAAALGQRLGERKELLWPISASAASRSAASLPSTYSRSGVCPSVTATFSFGLVAPARPGTRERSRTSRGSRPAARRPTCPRRSPASGPRPRPSQITRTVPSLSSLMITSMA